jgi:CRP-like cAMP-binding protein
MDGENVAEVGPGVVLGERAVLEGGIRTASLQASTPVRVAVAHGDRIDREALMALRDHHAPKTE